MTDEQDDHRGPRRIERSLGELIPPAWRDRQVWVSSYRAYRIPQAALLATEAFELLGVRGQLFWGGAPYLEIKGSMHPQIDGGIVVGREVGDVKHAPDGPYLLLMTPTALGSPPIAEQDTRYRLQSVLALLRLGLGPNIAVEPLGELIGTPSTGEVTVIEQFRPPTLQPPPDLSANSLELIAGLDEAVTRLEKQQRNRVEMSLRWAFRASEAFEIDGFLMYWFALESLLPEGANKITVLRNQLTEIYADIDVSKAETRFRLGRLYGLRINIVHHGLHPPIHVRMLEYLRAVYWDLLLHTLGLPAPRAAARVLDTQDLDGWLPKTKGG